MPYCHRNLEKYLIINKKNDYHIKKFFRIFAWQDSIEHLCKKRQNNLKKELKSFYDHLNMNYMAIVFTGRLNLLSSVAK